MKRRIKYRPCYYNFCFAEKVIEKVFKTGQPEDKELPSLVYVVGGGGRGREIPHRKF